MKSKPILGIIMGSDSDLPTMQQTAKVCEEFSIPYEITVASAHRTPNFTKEYCTTAHKRGIKVIIAGAGGAAHLPGVAASFTPLPVIGVPIQTKALGGIDSLLSIVQMPAGIPVATVAIGNGKNAGLLAVEILAVHNKSLLKKIQNYKKKLAEESLAKNKKLKRILTDINI
ncbi:MAG: 5-(carboxyamino)imidazole ribonucleotide mutase [Chlorobi bacterium]|nr:5-(carboxyamino)imidazole ribonucleotide mutase [Chlorobiota bacterium]MCI0714774.1 5-(carboxyamino)imidazole ribonucleotide mutase [Chlorobiota bacterium]